MIKNIHGIYILALALVLLGGAIFCFQYLSQEKLVESNSQKKEVVLKPILNPNTTFANTHACLLYTSPSPTRPY